MTSKEELHDNELDTQEYVYVIYSTNKIHNHVKVLTVCKTYRAAVKTCKAYATGVGADWFLYEWEKVPLTKE
jgi:hypothetical protein